MQDSGLKCEHSGFKCDFELFSPPNRLLFLVSKYQRPGEKKAAVPKNGDKPIHGLVSDKNFIVANAVENILAGK